MSDPDKEKYEVLCDRFLDGELGREDSERFQEQLRDSAELRRVYVRRSSLLASLEHYAVDSQATDLPKGEGKPKNITHFPKSREILAWAAVLLLFLGLAALFFSRDQDDEPLLSGANKTVVERPDEGVAVLLNSHDVVWSDPAASFQNGDSIPLGSIKMSSGVAHLDFYSGASMIIEGEAHVEVLDVDKIFCHSGQINVSVSPHAKGFTIATNDHEFVDLGTQFGLKVNEDEPTELHVFSGEVEVYKLEDSSADGGPDQLLKTGEAVKFASGSESEDIAIDSSSFWDARRLSLQLEASRTKKFKEWERHSVELSSNPDVVAYFPFYKTHSWSRKAMNVAKLDQPEMSGAIVGCEWTEGRWQNKSALKFNHPGDRVRFNIDGEFDGITLIAWIKVESLQNLYNGLFMTDGFVKGNPHWQINQEGRLVLGVRSSGQPHTNDSAAPYQHVLFSPQVITPERYGQWVQVACSYDSRTAEIRHYFNGRLVAQNKEGQATGDRVSIGHGDLGNWGLPNEAKPKVARNFDGLIGEMVLMKTVLSDSEVAEMFERGDASLPGDMKPIASGTIEEVNR